MGVAGSRRTPPHPPQRPTPIGQGQNQQIGVSRPHKGTIWPLSAKSACLPQGCIEACLNKNRPTLLWGQGLLYAVW